MIQNFRNKGKGKSLAILASGPSATEFKGNEDLCVAVNGGCCISANYDFFMAGDINTPQRSWWPKSFENRDTVRLLSSYIAPQDPVLYPCREFREAMIGEVEDLVYEGGTRYTNFVPSSIPQTPHAYFKFGGFNNSRLISPNQEVFYWGGTISGIALQFGLILGVSEVNLYGCNFSNDSGKDYAYIVKSWEGEIREDQRVEMRKMIDKVRSFGVEVSIKGETAL